MEPEDVADEAYHENAKRRIDETVHASTVADMLNTVFRIHRLPNVPEMTEAPTDRARMHLQDDDPPRCLIGKASVTFRDGTVEELGLDRSTNTHDVRYEIKPSLDGEGYDFSELSLTVWV